MEAGFAGDIPERRRGRRTPVVTQAAWAVGIAVLFVLIGVAWFFRSLSALPIVGLPALLGIGAAYAFAWFHYGYVNTTGLFLGAIILGNGINYPIVLLARYREFRSGGQPAVQARRAAAQNSLRAELVGAMVASIAYGSLTLTQFRGFSQFGGIGLLGMLFVWVAMIPCVPALIVATEWAGARFLARRSRSPEVSKGALSAARGIAGFTARAPRTVVALAALVTAFAASRIPSFLRDPWEYDFDRLGSRESKKGGAGEWSNKAERVFGGKMNVAGAPLAGRLPSAGASSQGANLLGERRCRPGWPAHRRHRHDLPTFFPDQIEEQRRKLEVLGRIRRIGFTPAVLDTLDVAERARVAGLAPPAALRAGLSSSGISRRSSGGASKRTMAASGRPSTSNTEAIALVGRARPFAYGQRRPTGSRWTTASSCRRQVVPRYSPR